METKKFRLLKILAIYIFAFIIGIIAAIFIPNSKLYGIIFYMALLVGVILYIKKEKCDYMKWFGKPDRAGIKRIATTSIFVMALVVIALLFKTVLLLIGEAEPFVFDIYACIGYCVCAPIIEEIVCRGIIVDILKEKHKDGFVIIVSALIFYIIHMNPTNIGAFLFGIFASWTVLKAKSIIPGNILHFIWNSVIHFSSWIIFMSDAYLF